MVAAALIGALMGVLDFVLFELQGNLGCFGQYVLYKPGPLSLSLLSFQLLSFVALGILCFCFFSLVWLILGKPTGKRGSFPTLPLFSVVFTLCMIALRFGSFLRGVERKSHVPFSPRLLMALSGEDWQQASSLLILILGSAVLVAYATVVHRTRGGATGGFAARLSLSPKSAFLVVCFLIVGSLLAPDVYSLYLRYPDHSRDQYAKAPNVLFVVLDTVRADRLSCYGYERTKTPIIDRIAREGVVFSNAFSTAPWTLSSHASMFTGLYPSQHQADWGHAYLDESFPTLAEHLRDAGYQTVAFSENPIVGGVSGLTRGFSEFHETWRRPLVVRALVRVATGVLRYKERLEYAERSVGLLERWVSNNNRSQKPFFAFVNLMAAHHPRYPRSGSASRSWARESLARIEPVNLIPEKFCLPEFKLNQQELAIMADIYDGEISYLDSQVGDLISSLAKAGILDETIVILTSDHGENFGEHGLLGHQLCLYDTLLRVPLILRYPALLRPERIEKRVSTVSLFKAVVTLVGTRRGGSAAKTQVDPSGLLQGQGFIVAEMSNEVDIVNRVRGEGLGVDFSRFDRSLKCVVEGNYKFIWSSNGKHELYRIERDPQEADNVIEKDQDQARALDQLLNSWALSTPRRLQF
jgi:arylsulfatase A-like enzyme